MKILFVTPYIPSHIRVRPYHFIRVLLQRGHEVMLLAIWNKEEELGDIQRLEQLGAQVHAFYLPRWRSIANCLAAMPTDKPLQSAYCWQGDLFAKLESLSSDDQFDVIHIEHLRGSAYGLRYLSSSTIAGATEADRPIRLPIVWDSVDCISHLFEQAARQSRSLKGRMMTRLELGRTRKYEAMLVNCFDQVTITSPVDRMALLRLVGTEPIVGDAPTNGEDRQNPASRVHVLPNGVDLDYFTPSTEERRRDVLVFSGKMSYHANVTAVMHLVNDIMPLVWSEQPQVELWIVGKDPTPAIRGLESEKPKVIVTGTVPDIRPYLRSASIAVAPMLYGAGIQNKVMEAMACGTPVVASSQAVSALQAKPGVDLIIADGSEATAAAVLQLFSEHDRQKIIGARGREYVEQQHSWDGIGARLESIYSAAQRGRVDTHFGDPVPC